MAQMVKNLPAVQETQVQSLGPGSGRSPGEGHGKPLQYSCLENFMDRGAWWATVHGVTKSWTQQRKGRNIRVGRERELCVTHLFLTHFRRYSIKASSDTP